MSRALALVLTVTALAGCAGEPPPNVVLVVIDTLRADRMGVYGHDRATTPHIDRLALEGERYERAFAQAPWTTPSVGALLTSLHPSSLGIRRIASPLPPDEVLLPEVLRDAGFATGGVVSHSFLSARWGFARGFDVFDESEARGQQAVTSAGVTDRAIRFVEAQADAPFFLFVHYFDPHFALVEHSDFRFEGEPYSGRVRSPVPFIVFGRPDAGVTAVEAREMLRIYDSEVAFTDHHVGRLLDDLRARGLYDRSLIVLTADHGEEFLDHGRLGHTKTLYDELIRVPLIVKWPGGQGGGSVREAPVALVDVFPTVLDVLGLPAPPGLRGRSLREEAPRTVFAETSRQAELRAVVRGDLKLVHDMASGGSALFESGSDPDERGDASARRPRERAELEALLGEWMTDARRTAPEPAPVRISPEERERLRALGYVE